MSRIPCLAAFAAALLAFALAGCATPQPRAFEASPSVRPGARVEIGRIELKLDDAPGIDEVAFLRVALEAAARKRGVLASGDPAEDRYSLNLEILEYEPGNAFKRWLLPGYGSTLLHVEGELVDERDGSSAGHIDHRRSVFIGGAYTIGAWHTIFASMADDIVRDFALRAEGGGFVVSLPPWAARAETIPRAPAARTFAVGEPTDRRDERGRIGLREAAFGVSMGDIHGSREVPAYLREVISDELRGQGHRVVESGPADVVEFAIDRFWLHTDTTPLYWDVFAEVELHVSIRSQTATSSSPEAVVACEARDRTWVYPSAKLMGAVLGECVEELMDAFRRATGTAGRTPTR